MLLRLYRVTDKFGTSLLKILAVLAQYLLEAVTLTFSGVQGGLLGGVAALWQVILAALRWLWRGLRALFQLMGLGASRVGSGTRGGVRNVSKNLESAQRVMARRAEKVSARKEIDVQITEDPLKSRNRLLSQLVVVMGFGLLGVMIWATSFQRASTPAAGTIGAEPLGEGVSFAQDVTATPSPLALVNTTVPTATPIPAVLQVRGSIAYVARERGQTDLWAVDVSSSTALRITNSPEDERDPEWSPDGQKLAYASRQDGNWELYVYDVIEDSTTRLTYDLSFQGNPSWSPDSAFLVYESYQGNNLDLYVVPIDGSQLPIRLTSHPAPDFSPSWSPDGRRIAFTSLRNGNQDIFIYSLDDPRDEASINLTNTSARNEDHAVWSPEGDLIAYSALDEGLEKVFVKPSDDPAAVAQVLERGRTPSWSPDGTSLVFAVDSSDSTHLVASPFTEAGVATEIIPVLRGSTSPSWSPLPLPPALINSGGLGVAVVSELYTEQAVRFDADPPYQLDTLVDVDAPNAYLSDAVNDSFNALRERANARIGYDFLGELEDAFWRIDRPPQPGEDRRNWLMTGRAFAINRNLVAGFPPPIEIVREDVGVGTYWRVYVRVADNAQNGQLGEPLRVLPWDLASRTQGDVESYDQGGRVRTQPPEGYYLDLTQLALDYGWERMPAGSDWRANFNSLNFWLFRKPQGLNWYESMREIYTEAQLGGFVPTATPPPSAASTG